MMKRVYTLTLGCRTNQYDAAATEEKLKGLGFESVDSPDSADLLVLQTCSVTQRADAKSLQAARKLAREAHGRTFLIAGCGPEGKRSSFAEIQGVSGVFGVNAANAIARHLAGEGDVNPEPFGSIQNFGNRTRAHLKIQEGCDAFCSYCIVPSLRGMPRSRPFDDVLNQARKLIGEGFPEIVLTGIHVGRYQWQDRTLADVIEALADLDGNFRIRLSSIEPNEVSDRLIRLVSTNPKVCNHLHVSLQSGDDAVLQRMNRHYRADDFIRLVKRIRQMSPFCGLGTDVIAGFPGETEVEWNNTLRRINESELTFGHVFPFSPRKGTVAEKMAGQVDRGIARARAKELKSLFADKRDLFMHALSGRELSIIFENDHSGLASNYVKVEAGRSMQPGSICSMPVVYKKGKLYVAA